MKTPADGRMSPAFQAAGTMLADIVGSVPKLKQRRNHCGAVAAAMMVGGKTINRTVSVAGEP
jgi:hypothetical protein